MFLMSNQLINKILPGHHYRMVRMYRFLMFDYKLAATPLKYLFGSVDKHGFEFFHKGDTVIWLWPWKRKDKKLKFVSVLSSGNGEFGDSLFSSLKEIDDFWLDFEKCLDKVKS